MTHRREVPFRSGLFVSSLTLSVLVLGDLLGRAGEGPQGPYRSPFDVAYSPDGKMLAVSDFTAGRLVLIDAASGAVQREVDVGGQATGVVWAPDGSAVYVAVRSEGLVAKVEPKGGQIAQRIAVGKWPMGLALAPKRQWLLAANSATNDVSVIDLQTGKERGRVPVGRWPQAAAVAPDESVAVVGNLLPVGSAADPDISCAVSLIDLEKLEPAGEIRLPAGSAQVREVAVGPEGRWAYVVHTVGRFTLPTTQLDRGWVNTNAFSILDLAGKKVYATLLLDHPTEGAADPWGLIVAGDGKRLWITIAGGHEIAIVRLDALHTLLAGTEDPAQVIGRPSVPAAWANIAQDPSQRDRLINDLAALYAADLLDRVKVPGKAPRGVDVSPDGARVAMAAYYSGTVLVVDSETGKAASKIALQPNRDPDAVRQGEMIFHDATYCFQHWLSCATCHPDMRADGLNWDLLNDGLGNPKNTRSLLLAHETPPMMSQAVREDMGMATLSGFRFILFREPEPGEVDAVRAYIRSVQPETSPYREANGDLSALAQRGKAIFESERTRCSSCHPGPLYTDLKQYDVGTRHELDRADAFDTPVLIELWRTGPYLHSGAAITLKDALTTYNQDDKHGSTSHLSPDDLDALIAFLLSL